MKQNLCVLLPPCLLGKRYFKRLFHVAGIVIISLSVTANLYAQSGTEVSGRVLSVPDNEIMPGVNVIVKGSVRGVITDANGEFVIRAAPEDVLVFSFIGYKSREIMVGSRTYFDVEMTSDVEMLDEITVYSTGYQELPEERITGSFEHIDEELITRSTGIDIISRMEGVTSGLVMDYRGADAGSVLSHNRRTLRIRGISTINSESEPLIVVDNFPYEGDISGINPNDVESITVLKDAAAASIWGARAGNGVIVITTKKGSFNQPLSISFSGNVTVDQRPDLYANPEFLASPDFIALEREMFERGFYSSAENSLFKSSLSPAVEIMILERDGVISAEEARERLNVLGSFDVRKDVDEYFFRTGVKQQYALNMNGGSEGVRYYFSAGLDKNKSHISGLEHNRVTISSHNTFRLTDQLSFENYLSIVNSTHQQNGTGWGGPAVQLPYNRLVDEGGNFLPVTGNYRESYLDEAENEGLMDWRLRPLEELGLKDDVSQDREYRINSALNYEVINGLNVNFRYQYHNVSGERSILTQKESYMVRDQVNRFTQSDGSSPFPYGDMLSLSSSKQVSHSGRLQATFDRTFNEVHQVNLLAGGEVREVHRTGSSNDLFGYDDNTLTYVNDLDYTARYNVRPRGRAYLPAPSADQVDLLDRFTSYYGNLSYTYDGRISFTASARRDASNLFGVKTNQKAVPLWSAGGAWEISREQFYNVSWMPRLRVRATYGYSGNVNRQATSFTTAEFRTSSTTNLPAAWITNPGNPQLRWEKVKIINLGVDVAFLKDRISGSLEYFRKKGEDLLGAARFDPTTGFAGGSNSSSLVNYAGTSTNGVEVSLSTLNLNSGVKWRSEFIFNYARTRLDRHFDEAVFTSISDYMVNSGMKLREGEYVDGLYALPWYGLDPATGDPIVYLEGQETKDYSGYYNSLEFEDLRYMGPGIPPFTGAIRNMFEWKDLSLSFNIAWKAGYYFRRSSINYGSFVSSWRVHRDAAYRWREPGDELVTNVPSVPENSDSYRNYVYEYSDALVEKGDHIRLQDINLGYRFLTEADNLAIKNARVFIYINNPGILWRANDKGLDPDYPNASLIRGRSISMGVQLGL